jgi:glutaredoxin
VARRPGVRSRSLSVLSSLGMYRGRNDGVVHAYVKLPLAEEAAKGTAACAGAAEVADEAFPGCEVAAVGVEDAASATSAWTTAPWQPEPPAVPDLDSAFFPGLRQILEDYPSSHPAALLYPEHDCPVPPPVTMVVEAYDDDAVDVVMPAVRDISEIVTGIVRARVDEFHGQMEKKKKKKKKKKKAADDDSLAMLMTPRSLPVKLEVVSLRSRPTRAGKPVVLYFTSLRAVRRTFEDCRAVRAILRCYRVRVDERDVSMHAAFKSELRDLLLAGGFEGGPFLPRVFVDGGKLDVGGADDVRALHEAGELTRVLAGCEAAPAGRTCAACGDARFVPCETCHGSCKVFVDDEGCRLAGCFQQCPDCNENGLIRCPVCCY